MPPPPPFPPVYLMLPSLSLFLHGTSTQFIPISTFCLVVKLKLQRTKGQRWRETKKKKSNKREFPLSPFPPFLPSPLPPFPLSPFPPPLSPPPIPFYLPSVNLPEQIVHPELDSYKRPPLKFPSVFYLKRKEHKRLKSY